MNNRMSFPHVARAMARWLPVLFTCVAFRTSSATLPPGFAEIQLAQGLNPTAMALAPDGRLFLAQKDGRILIMHGDGQLHNEPFIKLPVDDFNERGLAGIALHPDFAHEPWVYLYYTVAGVAQNRVSRVLANGDFAVPGSEQVLLDLDLLSGSIHNGGAMVFGPDDNLYIGTGDGASPANAQSQASLLGKILRISANGTIPVSNPFYNQLSGKNRAIYATGVRNPFSMSLDPASGRIFFCDVGNGAWEEVNEVKPGKNYGWNSIEGPLNGQTPPANYQEPLYAYPHSDGCAIVGATFGFTAHPSIPPAFQGKFFFADYCNGWIKMIDPATGLPAGTFASNVKRPVSLLITPGGDFYYIARAGLGGGSPGDNTVSNDGTLWKVFRIGEGKPRVTGQPKDVLAVAGESANFSIQAFGSQPITYKWIKNTTPVPGNATAELLLTNIQPADSGTTLYCIATNAFGADTSAKAVLHVTTNQRPAPEILFPSANTHYRCGDTLHFSGQATDPEEGALPGHRFSWRIDFHHGGHTHPAMPPVEGISGGSFIIPTVGETATDVYFRIYLSAKDTAGLVKTVWRDVQPEFTQVTVTGPPGVPLNVDGQIRYLPVSFESVINIQRNLQASLVHQSGDTSYYFKQWSNGQTTPVFTFQATETPLNWSLEYDVFSLGNGTGLRGAYFFDPEANFGGVPTLSRLDTIVNFDWGEGSPAPNQLPVDYFSVRWTGFVQAVFSEAYTFSVSSDDGCRLWIGDSLLIDKWVPQAATEHSGTITLQGGQQYPIRLEYFEIGGGASAQLFWKSPRQPKQIIPKRQLYEPDTIHTGSIRGITGIDTNLNGLLDMGETPLPGVTVSLYMAQNDSLIDVQQTLANGQYLFLNLAPGEYYLYLEPAATSAVLSPSENLDDNNRTPVFLLNPGEFRTLNVAWIISQTALYGTVWLDENRNDLREPVEPGVEDIAVLLYRADSVFTNATATNAEGGYLFPMVEPGDYFLLFSKQLVSVPLMPGFGINAQGSTPVFSMNAGQGREILVAFVPEGLSATGEFLNPEKALLVYPNPATSYLRVSLFTPEDPPVSLEVHDAAGRLVYSKKLDNPAIQHPYLLSVSDLESGIYLLTCRTQTRIWQKKWVKAKP